MQTFEIMIINRLKTNTAFAATVEGNQAVFIPAKVASSLDIQVGERFKAILIENTIHPKKTPWVAIRIIQLDQSQQTQVQDDLTVMILKDLSENGRASVEDVAENINYPVISVIAKMQEMARGGVIKRKTFYAVEDDDFYDSDE